jgi:Fe-S cluster biogenesis protein NfuA
MEVHPDSKRSAHHVGYSHETFRLEPHLLSVYTNRFSTFLDKETNMREQVQAALDMIRPNLQADGGDAELVDVTEDGVVKVRLKGACGGCPMSQMTLKMGIERIIKERVPSVKTVESVA